MITYVLSGAESAHSANVLGGDDTVVGSHISDLIYLGTGNDYAQEGSGSDTIFGEEGNDIINGESGNDLLIGGAGNDSINGGQGSDLLFGNQGDDYYDVSFGSGEANDIINDGLGPSSDTGNGSGIDTLYIKNVTGSNLYLQRFGNDLIVSTKSDAADGFLNGYVTIQNNYLNLNNRIYCWL